MNKENIFKMKFVQNVMKVFSVKALLFIVGMGTSIFSARVLGPDGKGVFSVAAVIYGMGVQFGNLGMHSANTYYISKERDKLPFAVGNSMLLAGIAALISLCLLAYFYFLSPSLSLDKTMLILAFAYIPIQLYAMFQQNFFIAIGGVHRYNVIEILTGTLYPIFLLGIYMVDEVSPETALFASMTATFVVIIIGFFLLKPDLKDKIKVNILFLKECLPFGIKSYIACLLSYMVLRVDVLMLDSFLDKRQTGLYSLAVNLVDILNMISSTISMLLFPELVEKESFEKKLMFLKKILIITVGLLGALSFIAILVSEYAIGLLYGEEYIESAAVFYLLLPGMLAWSLAALLSSFFSSENRLLITIIAPGTGLLVNVICNCALIPKLGIRGAAISSTISYIVIFMVLFIYLYKIYSKEKQRML